MSAVFRSWAAFAAVLVAGDDWTRWGGPSGDFQVEAAGIVEAWPASGPVKKWEVELGDGYSAVLFQDGRLVTMYREGEVEVVVALEAETGELVWDFAYDAGRYPDMDRNFGEGPNATPLILGDRVVSIGITGKAHCLRLATGDPVWELDLHAEFGRQRRREEYGYSGSPLEYGGNVLVLVGGERHAVVALDPEDGSLVWGSPPGRVSYAPARLMRLCGKDQLVYFSPTEVVGLDPENGRFLWTYPVECRTQNNLTSAVACGDDHLWVATQLDGGTRVLEIDHVRGEWTPKAVWTSRSLKQGHWSAIRVGDHVYGALGDSNSMLGAVSWRTGEIAWKERRFPGAQIVHADGKLILVDETGQLALVRANPGKLDVLCSYPLLEEVAWTAPTLVGTTLYARDKRKIVALDLAAGSYD